LESQVIGTFNSPNAAEGEVYDKDSWSFFFARCRADFFNNYCAWAPQTTAKVVGKHEAQPASPQQLDSLVAPIALYPDSLLAQVFAASYPLEIVNATRFVKQHSQLEGKALLEAAGKQDWDPSVQALVASLACWNCWIRI
jgi:hypothetical protein